MARVSTVPSYIAWRGGRDVMVAVAAAPAGLKK